MIVASGFVVINELDDMERVVSGLKAKEVEVNDAKDDKIVFLVEKETVSEAKALLDSLKDVEGVRSIYLAYYSLEGSDKDLKDLLPFSTH